jgi:hypothetical protein
MGGSGLSSERHMVGSSRGILRKVICFFGVLGLGAWLL